MTAVARRHWLAPEVIQSSMMDCGPASLKSVLEGFGIPVGYGRLREACSTDVDGSSIDTIEEVARELGLAAQQVMVPLDHLLLVEAAVAPAILVLQRPHSPAHFIVLWRLGRGLVQVMDPAVGRRWVTGASLLREVHRHRMPVDALAWRDWAVSEAFQAPLSRRIRDLGLSAAAAAALVGRATADPTWRTTGLLDAAVRMLEKVAASGGIRRDGAALPLIERALAGGVEGSLIPERFWTVRPTRAGDDGEEQVLFTGAVLVHIEGAAGPDAVGEPLAIPRLSEELRSAIQAPVAVVWAPFRQALALAGVRMWTLLVPALAIAAFTVVVQAVLLRSVLDIGHWLGIGEHRLGAAVALFALIAGALLLDVPINLAVARLGRKLEVALRMAFLRKLPRIADPYLHSRLLSDMAERLHAIAVLRSLPALASGWLRSLFAMLFTGGGIVWLAPSLAPWVVASVVVSMLATWASIAFLQDREMRLRSHGGTLIRFYLDALMGISSIRAHGAGKSLQREQEALLVYWSDANRRLQVGATWVEALQAIAVGAIAVAMVLRQVAAGGTTGSILLITYWALELPVLAQGLAVAARQLPPIRNVLIRLLEPLDAPEETASEPTLPASDGPQAAAPTTPNATQTSAITAPLRREGVHVSLSGVTVRAGGHDVLDEVSLTIEPGRQVAVVGRSGAGKSTLVGLLLGWFRAASGSVRLDGEPLTPTRLAKWRRHTAWVDPGVQLFNRRFVDNLLYGSESGVGEIAGAVEDTELREVLERLPEGLQTILGEGGALVSGGEGQRLRLGRAWLRQDVRLVLLDEPFRGLDRQKRRDLLARAREHWRGATLLCVTHDIGETLGFDRVIVVDGGRIAEDGDPRELASRPSSLYGEMLRAEVALDAGSWQSASWRRVRVEGGRVREQPPRPPPPSRLPTRATGGGGV